MHVGRTWGAELLEVLEAPSGHVVDDIQKLAVTDRTPLLLRRGTAGSGTDNGSLQRFQAGTCLRNPTAARIPFEVRLAGDHRFERLGWNTARRRRRLGAGGWWPPIR